MPRLLNPAPAGFPRHVRVSNAAFAQESPDDRESAPVCPSVELPPRATASGRLAEVAMHDELAARQRAIALRLAGRPTRAIGIAVGRFEVWFRKWWVRYQVDGPRDSTT